MTTPTPAQIEAGCGCSIPRIEDCREFGFPHGCYHAAAQVGGTEIDRLHGIIKDMDGAIDKLEQEKSATKPTQLELERLNKIMERNETIERCARWLEDTYPTAKTIAIEMRRKLKDER